MNANKKNWVLSLLIDTSILQKMKFMKITEITSIFCLGLNMIGLI